MEECVIEVDIQNENLLDPDCNVSEVRESGIVEKGQSETESSSFQNEIIQTNEVHEAFASAISSSSATKDFKDSSNEANSLLTKSLTASSKGICLESETHGQSMEFCEVDLVSEDVSHTINTVSCANSAAAVQPSLQQLVPDQTAEFADIYYSNDFADDSDISLRQSKEPIDPESSEVAPKFIGPIYPEHASTKRQGEANENLPLQQVHENIPGIKETSQDSVKDHRYNLSASSVPKLLRSSISEFQNAGDENFLRGCKWSPDGNWLLTNSNDNYLRIFYPFTTLETRDTCSYEELVPKIRIKECSQIYDFAWHPQLSDSNRIACTCAGIPIHMWNAETGRIMANYRAYDQYDEITAAYSLSFSLDGSKIYAGYNKIIRVFDADYPVRPCRTVKTFNSQKKDGQTGIISCFAHSPDGNGLYVAGSYSRHIGIYDSACDKLVCLMQGQQGGVTHLLFSPDGTKLFSGGRKDAEILCWDMRNMGKILFSALREVRTNQRIYFDLSNSGRFLMSGNQDGSVVFWDTFGSVEEINGEALLKPCSQFQAHRDCVNGVSFSPKGNLVATASGQRHFRNFETCDSDSSSDDADMETSEPWDFSLRVWQIPLLH